MFKIGNVEIKNRVVLAPMAGVCNSAFRRIIKEMGAGLLYAEMVSDKALVYNNEKTKEMLYMTEDERPISQQIFGSDKESFVEAAKIIEKSMHPDIIDINMGCPANKITKNGEGSALLKDPKLAGNIVEAIKKVSTKPVTVKFRKGWDADNIVAIEAAKVFEQAGASAITIHGRTRTEYYSGKSDLDIIKQVKDAVKIPVIGNGDIIDGESAKRMFEYTGVDGIMIGRASIGKPFIFKEVQQYLKNEQYQEPKYEEILNIIIRHIELEIKTKGEKIGIKEMRKHISSYLKGMPRSAEAREKINKITDKNELENYLKEYFENIVNINKLGC